VPNINENLVWTNKRECPCYATHEEKAQQLVGLQIAMNAGERATIQFRADSEVIYVRNKLDLQAANDLVYFFHHIRHCYFDKVGCWRARSYSSEKGIKWNIEMNPAICSLLSPLRVMNFYVSLPELMLIQESLANGFLKVRTIHAQNDYQMGDFHDILSAARHAEQLVISKRPGDVSQRDFITTVLQHFTTTLEDLRSICKSTTFGTSSDYGWFSCQWPASIPMPVDRSGVHKFDLTNTHSGEKIQIKMLHSARDATEVKELSVKIIE